MNLKTLCRLCVISSTTALILAAISPVPKDTQHIFLICGALFLALHDLYPKAFYAARWVLLVSCTVLGGCSTETAGNLQVVLFNLAISLLIFVVWDFATHSGPQK